MTLYKKYLSVADICIQAESGIPFNFSKYCIPFERESGAADAIFSLNSGSEPDVSGYHAVYNGPNFTVSENNAQQLTIYYDDNSKQEITWFIVHSRHTPVQYHVYLNHCDSVLQQGINPLMMAGLTDFLTNYNALLLHASVISYHGRGIAFSAPSGTGKSTQAALWQTYKGASIINGDRAVIRKTAGYRVYGSPYAGSSKIYKNEYADLAAIVILRQAKANHLRRMTPKEAFLCILSELSVSSWNRDTVRQQSGLISELVGAVPVYLLECLPDQGAVELLYQELQVNQSDK